MQQIDIIYQVHYRFNILGKRLTDLLLMPNIAALRTKIRSNIHKNKDQKISLIEKGGGTGPVKP